MKIAIIGAGLAGLGAAATLRSHDIASTVFESRNAVGGRVQTEVIGDFIFDAGATSFAPRGHTLEKLISADHFSEDLVRIEKPIHVHANNHISAGTNDKRFKERYTYTGGNHRLPLLLSNGHDVLLNHRVNSVQIVNGVAEVDGVSFDRVIFTTPIPVTIQLLKDSGIRLAAENVHYRPCISVLLGYETEFSPPYHAVIEPEQRHPLTWLSVESAKCTGRAPTGCTGLVAQLGPEYSRKHFGANDDEIIQDSETMIERLLGPKFSKSVVQRVVRFQHSQPETTALFETLNHHREVIIAGDGVLGGRTELAYETGVLAAQRIMQSL